MSLRKILPILLLLLVPAVVAHEGHETEVPVAGDGTGTAPDDIPPWLSRVENGVWYGTAHALHASSAPIVDVRASGDWVVWESGFDIVGMNAESGVVFNITRDAAKQQSPAVDGRHVVFEQRSSSSFDLWIYDMDAGTLKQLTNGPGNERDPAILGDLVAWIDDRSGRSDVYGMNLTTGEEIPLVVSEAKKSDVRLLPGVVAWREIEYNQWDVAVRRLAGGPVQYLTRDRTIEYPPQTHDGRLYWAKQPLRGPDHTLWRWDPATNETLLVATTGVTANPITFLPGNVELVYRVDGPRVSFMAVNRTTGKIEPVGGPFDTGTPATTKGMIFLPVRNATHYVMWRLRLSPYAVQPPPALVVERPLEGAVLFNATTATGRYAHAPAWPAPSRLEYRLGGGAWHSIPATSTWSIPLDPSGREDGAVRFQLRVVYPDAPPVERSVSLTVRTLSRETVNLDQLPHVTFAIFVEKNPGVVLLFLLVGLLLALLLVRWALRRPQRLVYSVEYVRPDER